MSWIHIPDPHPGRCQNLRPTQYGDGRVEYRRCLDYDNHSHVCRFERPVYQGVHWGASNVYDARGEQPKPWVAPPVQPELLSEERSQS